MLRQIDRRFEQRTLESDERPNSKRPCGKQSVQKEPTGSRRQRDSEAILSLTEAIYSECAVDADALGFMAKMLDVRRYGVWIRDEAESRIGKLPPSLPGEPLPTARHIEVKGRAKGSDTITVTRNEIPRPLRIQ